MLVPPAERPESAADWLAAHWPLLLHVASRTGLALHDAEDAAQTAALKCWLAWGDYAPDRGTRTAWATAITRHAAYDLARRERTRAHEALTPALVSRDAEADALTRVALVDAWTRLAPHQRDYVTWLWAGYDQQECADRAGVPLGTFKTRLRAQRAQSCAAAV